MPEMNYLRFLSKSARARYPQPIRETYEHMVRSGVDFSEFINMAAGLPNSELFPIASAEFHLKDGSTITIGEDKMAAAQQYGPTTGHPPFTSQVKDFIRKFHDPPTMKIHHDEGGLDFCVIPGAQAGVQMCLDLLLNPGDSYIVEEPSYVGVLGTTYAKELNLLPVATDDQGMIPSKLRKLLEKWGPGAAKDPSSDIPKVIYVVPVGTNPSGVTITEDRRREIYKIAQEYDLVIIEDDPYYFLDFSQERAPSFLSLDTDGRVIRLDSFSKIIAPGLRVGVASGPEPFIRRIVWDFQVNSGHAASLSQVLIGELFNKWGNEGLQKHIERCRNFYKRKRDSVIKCADLHLTGLAEWVVPSAGMFLWMKIHGIEDTKSFIEGSLAKQRVLFMPGYPFMADPDKPYPFMRVSFSNVSEDEMDKAFQCLAVAIKDELAKVKTETCNL